ncbi:putative protein CXorf58 [Rhizophlyctis rosea]|uniref:Uncharacterized protein n=1 Tax=Rhizophlyctis rosea TaxID=64517 RepID=A0AAD5S521_9FUNG|nr:putative protein CXorf58 [Rhizophlyctis rosea]
MTFAWLKQNLYKAEQSMTLEILRRLSPKEAELIRDPVMQAHVRFRFGGTSFPPSIMYKIFTKGMNTHYFTGKRVIQAGSKAARDSCNIMGVRLFAENMFLEEYYSYGSKIRDSVDVTNRIEFVQYLNTMDKRPAHQGGRNNGWRELSVTPLAAPQLLLLDPSTPTHHPRPRRKQKPSHKKHHKRPAYLSPPSDSSDFSSSSPSSSSSSTPDPHERNWEERREGYDGSGVIVPTAGIETEEEFGNLFEWTNGLSLDGMEDYVVAG